MGSIAEAFANVFREFIVDGVPASGANKPSKFDARQLGSDIEAAIATNLGNVSVAKTTKSLLDADLAHPAPSTALVYADSTDANNDLYIKSGASGSGSWTNTHALHNMAAGLIEPYLSELRDGIFYDTVADAYLRAIVKRISIEGGPPGRSYVLNYLSDNAGGNRRLSFYLYDPVRGANVAVWAKQKNYDWTSEVPESVFLTGAANGSVRGDVDYIGLTVTLWLDQSAISFTHNLTSYTTTAQAGILPQNVMTNDERRRRIMSGEGLANRVITVHSGGDGDFTTTRAAVDSLMSAATPASVERGYFPFSDICTPSNQVTIRYLPGHTESISPRQPGATAVGVIAWEGLTFEFARDTVLTTNGVVGAITDGPLFEANYGGRFILAATTLLENTSDQGDVIHMDSGNALTVVSEANAADPTAGVQYFCPTFYLNGGLLKGNKRVIAHGISQGELLVFENATFKEVAVSGNLAPFVAHDSAGSTNPARMEFRNVIFIHPGGGASVDLIKQNARTTRDEIAVTGCDASQVQTTNTVSGASPTPGFVRMGKISAPTVSSDLDP